MSNTIKLTQPHAAALVFNYRDRLGTEPTVDTNTVEEVLISTLSMMEMKTTKSKGAPTGEFELTLAPTKNWVSTLTSGSWVVIMMSRTPILEKHIRSANRAKVKMFGKIETVRVDVQVNPQTGARQTVYRVKGVDWGHVFENVLYVDPFIAPGQNTLGEATALDIFKRVKGSKGISPVLQMMTDLLSVMGKPLDNELIAGAKSENRVAQAGFSFEIPKELNKFFGFTKKQGTQAISSDKLLELLEIISGRLVAPDTGGTTRVYEPTNEAVGIVNPSALKGSNTFWQLLVEHSNPALNEMMPELRWNNNGRPTLAIYHRIRPFVFKGKEQTVNKITQSLNQEHISKNPNVQRQEVASISAQVKALISEFQNVRTHKIDLPDVIAIEAGTNWRDKYNFIEIKPDLQGVDTNLGIFVKRAAQVADTAAFAREGLRPLIVPTKQMPKARGGTDKATNPNETTGAKAFDINSLYGWKGLIREWHFDTHRLLNGSMVFVGQDEYIQVGDNVMVDIQALGPTPNIKEQTLKGAPAFMLAHVESISHHFSVDINGARSFISTVNFVRGIIVDTNKKLVGAGKLDNNIGSMSATDDKNSRNTISTSTLADPDPQKLRGN